MENLIWTGGEKESRYLETKVPGKQDLVLLFINEEFYKQVHEAGHHLLGMDYPPLLI